MAMINVNPTRLELMKLKKKLNTARRGHRLLKDKRDELMRRFTDMIKETVLLRDETEKLIMSAETHMAVASSSMTSEQIETALLMRTGQVVLNIEKTNVMGTEIPDFKAVHQSSNKSDICSYGYAFTSGELDEALFIFDEAFEKLIKLAQAEKSCWLMADEIEKTRRRVNALEHTLIPRYEQTIRYISAKLEENERSAVTRLIKVKENGAKRA